MQSAEAILKKHGMRITQFRLDVLNIISTAGSALSNQDIENKLHDPDRITLYRTLKSFEDKGIIHRALDSTQTAKYALCAGECTEHKHHHHHVHFHCIACENTFCVDNVAVPSIELPSGYHVLDINIIVDGTCEKCR
ncbi:MAG: transcriptional repressor [Saprospiraceae bacterium]|nr:transcriptional repressor [Saprospiraceae bacterium]